MKAQFVAVSSFVGFNVGTVTGIRRMKMNINRK
jgi:hypothetical protein